MSVCKISYWIEHFYRQWRLVLLPQRPVEIATERPRTPWSKILPVKNREIYWTHLLKFYFARRCCNTCEEVLEAYRRRKWAPPEPSEVKQCQNDKSMEKLKHAFTQGCQIYGYMEVNRVGGSFHIAPGASFSVNHVHGKLTRETQVFKK